ncbi:MAG: hypothetical protein WC043_02935 [Pseudobdellovibrionaceae bacterium]
MGNDYKKQTSAISASVALETLLSKGFEAARVDEITSPKKAYAKDVNAARRRFGDDAAISITGRSITLVGEHATAKHRVTVDVPLFEMLGHGARQAIESKTGITLANS